MRRILTPDEKLEAARRVREEATDIGVQIARLTERKNNLHAEADRLMREADQERGSSGSDA